MKKKMKEEIFRARSKKEILAAHEELDDKLWFYRHSELCRSKSFLSGLRPDIREGALATEERIREKYAPERLYPLDSYELGMLEGKLSAIRWVLGDEWDELHT